MSWWLRSLAAWQPHCGALAALPCLAQLAVLLETTIDRFIPSDRAAIYCSVLIFLLPAMALTTRVSVGLIEAALLLTALAYALPLIRQYRQYPVLFTQARPVVVAFGFNLAVALISLFATGFDPRFMENPSKMLLATLLTGVVLLLRPTPRFFWFGLYAGTIGATLFALYQRFAQAMPRAEGFSMPITFGDLAMALGLMSLASIQPFARTRWAALPYVSFLSGVVASILSGSRGGWLALLLSFIPLYSYGRHALGRRTALIMLAAVAVLGAASVVPQTGLRDRVMVVSKDIHQYNIGNPDTSVGARLEMWKGAWTLFVEHPLTGVGRANFNQGLRTLIARGDINPAMRDFYHAHNELLNALSTQGLLGALALLGLYASPLLFFTRALRQPGLHRPYALAGVMLVLGFIDFGLTEVMFAHHVGSSFYALCVCTLMGLCLQAQRKAALELTVSGPLQALQPAPHSLPD